jgi:antitoxin ParD1/3/4
MARKLSTMNISLPASMRGFIAKRMEAEGFANTSEYMRSLVRREEARVEANLKELVLEGLNSGPGVPLTREFMDEIMRRVRADPAAPRASRPTRRKAG